MNQRENCKVCLGFYSDVAQKSLQMYSKELKCVWGHEEMMKLLDHMRRFIKDWKDSVGDCQMITVLSCRIESAGMAIAKGQNWGVTKRNDYARQTAKEVKVVIDAMIKSIDIT